MNQAHVMSLINYLSHPQEYRAARVVRRQAGTIAMAAAFELLRQSGLDHDAIDSMVMEHLAQERGKSAGARS